MKEQKLPIGSVIKVEDKQMMVVGYTVMRTENRPVIGYVVVPHPTGYMGKADVHYVENSKVEIIQQGYISEASDFFCECQNILDKGLRKMSQDAIEKLYKQLDEGENTNAG